MGHRNGAFRDERELRLCAAQIESGEPVDEILSIARYFCRSAKMRIDTQFAGISEMRTAPANELRRADGWKHADLRKGMSEVSHPG